MIDSDTTHNYTSSPVRYIKFQRDFHNGTQADADISRYIGQQRKQYSGNGRRVSAAPRARIALKILYDAMHSKADYSFYTIFVLLYLPALALYVLISRKTKKGSMLAFTGIVLLGIFIFRFPASADNIAVGVYAAFAGLAAITAAVLKKQR